MKKLAFLVSHLYSGSHGLANILNENPRLQCFQSNFSYSSIDTYYKLTSNQHKIKGPAAIYMDEILFNQNFSFKPYYNFSKFVYMIREPRPVLNFLIGQKIYDAQNAFMYYCFRLTRICEMATKTPKAVFVTWQKLLEGQGYDKINDYLNLKEPLVHNKNAYDPYKNFPDTLSPYEYIKRAEDHYEKCLYFLKNQDLLGN
jgi:hypothetical protein